MGRNAPVTKVILLVIELGQDLMVLNICTCIKFKEDLRLLKLARRQAIHQVKSRAITLQLLKRFRWLIGLGRDLMVLNICRKLEEDWSKDIEVEPGQKNTAAHRG